MAAINTSNIVLPKEVAKGIIAKVRDTSTIQALSAAMPRPFKDVEHMTFTTEPEAEFVGEGGQKSPTPTAPAEKIKFGNSTGSGENVSSHFGSDGNETLYTVVVDELWNGTGGKPTCTSCWVYPKCSVNDVALGYQISRRLLRRPVLFSGQALAAYARTPFTPL